MTASRGTAVVSGVLSIIGLAYADYLATNGHDLILIDQDRAGLNAVAEELSTQTRRAVEVVAVDRGSPSDVAMIAQMIDQDASVVLVVSVTEQAIDNVSSSTHADSIMKSVAFETDVCCAAVRKFTSGGGAANLYRASVVVASVGPVIGSAFAQ